MTFDYIPKGVCARKFTIQVEDGVIRSVKAEGGCNGNLQGVAALLQGMTPEEAVRRMEGIRCGMKKTSCPDQIAQALKLMGQCGVKKAVALRPITKAEAILPYLEELDLVLVMTVEPGFGGQAFMESQLDTIRQVRALIERYNPACELEVDGGISPKTAPLVVEAGANVLVAGSAVYGAEDIPAAIQALRVSGGVRGERV